METTGYFFLTMTTIGIHLYSDPARLRTTLASLKRHAPEAKVVLLADGAEPDVAVLLEEFTQYPQISWPEPLGAAAAFNRLIVCDDAPLVVFLESGAVVTEGWLVRIQSALETIPASGLAGPSTNFAWNEQCLRDAPRFQTDPPQIDLYARQLAIRYGDQAVSLTPLYSLCDFCYAVKRSVIQAIGGADEGYGLGPCWEMEYNIRAARAGFTGLWVQGAYVHRPPHATRRERSEYLYFTASKRLYQDSLCGLRLRGAKTTYETHCRGDACPHFAPPDLIRRVLPAAQAPQRVQGWAAPAETESPSTRREEDPAGLGEPLVTCIMPTCDRRAFIPLAARCFLQQDYPNLELIVVDDGSDAIGDCLPDDPHIRYRRVEGKRSIGEKRNIACADARGEIIVHWDDDDWYPSHRVRVQTRVILEQAVDICGSTQLYFFEPASDRAWLYNCPDRRTVWVAGNTLAYRKSFWARNPFRPIQIGEDAHFVACAPRPAVYDLQDPALCIATIHPGNAAPKVTAGVYWHVQPVMAVHALMESDLDRYRTALRVGGPFQTGSSPPLVSCIMPTCNRRAFVTFALELYLQQDYANKELIVVDDGTDPVDDLFDGLTDVRYLRMPRRITIGAKRNLACREARGEIIAHWDDDDWFAPNRLRYQIEPILRAEADITGLENTFTLQVPASEFWTTSSTLHQRMFVGNVHGGTLVFRKSLLEQGLRYPEASLAEDAMLLRQVVTRGGRLACLSNPGVFVYVRHGQNAWRFDTGRFLEPAGWQRIAPPPTFPAGTIERYREAAGLGCVTAEVSGVVRR